MTLGDCVRSALRNWFLLLSCALLAGLTTFFAVGWLQPQQFRSTSKLAVGPGSDMTDPARIAQTLDGLTKRTTVTTFVEMITSDQVLSEATKRAGMSKEDAARYQVSAIALPEANVVELSVEGPKPGNAEGLSRGIVAEAVQNFESFYKIYSVRELEVASTPQQPVRPQPMQAAELAAVIGLCVGFLLGLLRDHRRARPAPTPTPSSLHEPALTPTPGPGREGTGASRGPSGAAEVVAPGDVAIEPRSEENAPVGSP